MIKKNKNEIRKKILQLRRLNPSEKKIKSLIIQERAIELILNKKLINLLSYMCFKTEVETKFLNNFLINNKINLSIPRVLNNEICFYLIRSLKNDVEIGNYGIYEPKSELKKTDYNNIDIAIIPGVAFDLNGYRLGYGKGFYDRFLSKYEQLIKIGLAFECQIVENIPVEKHDKKMDYLITENNIIVCKENFTK